MHAVARSEFLMHFRQPYWTKVPFVQGRSVHADRLPEGV
jgi:hypothetical protein